METGNNLLKDTTEEMIASTAREKNIHPTSSPRRDVMRSRRVWSRGELNMRRRCRSPLQNGALQRHLRLLTIETGTSVSDKDVQKLEQSSGL